MRCPKCNSMKTTKNGVKILVTGNRTQEYKCGDCSRYFSIQIAVDDIYELCTILQNGGVTILRPPRDGRMAFVRSPDHISVELLQKGSPLPPKEPWLSMSSTGSW